MSLKWKTSMDICTFKKWIVVTISFYTNSGRNSTETPNCSALKSNSRLPIVKDRRLGSRNNTKHNMAPLTEATEEEYARMGQESLRREGGKTDNQSFDRRYRRLFGPMTPKRTASLWNRLVSDGYLGAGAKKCHLLWALLILKVYSSETAMCSIAGGVDEKEFRTWGWLFVEQISWLGLSVINWENRKKGDTGNDCLVSVDCTHCPTRRYTGKSGKKASKGGPADPFYSWKLKGPGLSYEVAVSILHGDIVHIAGPYPARDWNDINIFRDGLIGMLEEGERVEADDGYVGEEGTK